MGRFIRNAMRQALDNAERQAAASMALALACMVLLAGCGGSGGSATPPAPPAPVTPPAPAPDPGPTTPSGWIEQYAGDDDSDCRAGTPGFGALAGWIGANGAEMPEGWRDGSRVWILDSGEHGADVEATFNDCAMRERARLVGDSERTVLEQIRDRGADRKLLLSRSGRLPGEFGAEHRRIPWAELLNGGGGETPELMVVIAAGNDGRPVDLTDPLRSPALADAVKESNAEQARWIVVGGYTGDAPAAGSSRCGDAEALCLFAPWSEGGNSGTSIATPQVSAALDTVWAVWPSMSTLDLRNLAFDCAENRGAADTTRTYSYSAGGGTFTSNTNSTWGHGILSLECLFTANGGLEDPTTGNRISGGIYGPLAGVVAGASITGVDYTGRDFSYGFARPVVRENPALASLANPARANLRPVQAISGMRAHGHASGSVSGRLWQSGALRVDLTASGAGRGIGGAAIGMRVAWQAGGFTFAAGVAGQPEGAGSLTGARAFRAPSTVSAAVSGAYAKALPYGFSVHLQADHWRTVATRGRSLWQSADLAESRIGAALVRRFAPREGVAPRGGAGRHEVAMQALWQSGLAGSVNAGGRSWAVAGRSDAGVWLSWRYAR